MPRFPTYERQQGLQGGATASYVSEGPYTAPARALGGAGDALAGVGEQLSANAERVQNSLDDTWFSKARAETAKEIQSAEIELRQAASGGGEGYTDSVRARNASVRDRWINEAPSPRARQMYEEWSNGFDADVTNRSALWQAGSTIAKRDSDFAQTVLAHAQTVLADPSQYGAVHKRAMDDLEGAKQWMTPQQEIAARQEVESQLQLARAKAEIQTDPAAFLKSIGVSPEKTGEGAVASVVDRIIGAESGGNANAKNPNSSASGVGQFTDGTWIETVRKHRPDMAIMSDREILELKNDPALGREMTVRLTEDNAASLAAAGLPATAGNLYLAHFAGIGGAKKVLSASDDTSVASVLDASAIKANPFLKGMTVADLKAWSEKKMGGAGTPHVAGDPRFSSLDVGQVLGLQQQAESQLASVMRQHAADQTAQLASIKGAFQLGIATGDTSVTQHEIMSSPLADDDKAQLIKSLNSERSDSRLAADAIRRIDAGEALNPYNSDDKKGVSLAYDSVTQGASLFGEGNASAALGYMYSRSHIVPTTAKNEIRAGLLSSDPKRVAAAASYASLLSGIDSGGLEAAESGADLVKAATTYDHMTQTLGLTNEEAGQRMMDMRDPEKQRQREALLQSEPVKKRIKNIDAGEVRDVYDPGLFGFDPKLGENPAAEAAMVGDYKDMFEESVLEASGDLELAKELAAQKFRRLYAPSPLSLSGAGVITRLPPEVTYPAVNGSHDYIRSQAIEALQGEGVQASEVFLQTYEGTEQDFSAGKSPRYQIWYRGEDGKLELYNLPFYADPTAVKEDFSANRERRDANLEQEEARQRVIRGEGDFNELHFPGRVDETIRLPAVNVRANN